MSDLIDALLAISVITRQEIRKKTVNLSALANDVILNLKEQQPDRKIVCRVHENMVAHADPTLVRVIYTMKTQKPRIEIGFRVEHERFIYFVKDNGIGFDTQYATKVFAPFQRFHKAEDFPGFAIGLATVKRVVMMHGGEIWVNSVPNKGATFEFTLGN